ncbi:MULTISPECIES: hypothetical protein [Acinetobacter]|uniref:hypothetical protein n=1 Tax=Acinetobacter TaxID=469 RepID=UPI00044A4FB5|nr:MULTISPECIES: hypothetical protein [Acinetobacter]EXB48683.1 hypothetical protein J522_0258 [Acinetobacter baumannii 146457]EYT22545.1 hypothetical protein J699_01030 [Acinetobacter sp. 1000160]MBJ9956106.1 hypothetical protein [Acinetobacter courvalinii]
MIKKTLENKIQDTIFGTVVFFIIYGIIGFLLETNWLTNTIELKRFYEILKDGLTITASFLAPVAAFVLFTDWRQEHVAKILDSIGRKIKVDINDLKIHFTRAHFLNAVEINKKTYVVELIKHPVKGSILDMRLSLMNDLLELKTYSLVRRNLIDKLQDFINLTVDLENVIRMYKFQENEIKEAYVRADSSQIKTYKVDEKALMGLTESYLEFTNKLECCSSEINELLEELILH